MLDQTVPGIAQREEDSRPLLEVRNLRTVFKTDEGTLVAVDDVSFEVGTGEVFSIVGESGSGKSVTALSIMGLIGGGRGEVAGGRIRFADSDLTVEGERRWRHLRGKEMSMIFQDPMTSLNPVYTVGDQVAEVARIHTKCTRSAAMEAAIEMLARVGIPNPRRRATEYPHQFSGGMRQRAMIAMAMIGQPRLLIADEPTTALDVTIQAQILELLADIRSEYGTSILLITHDLGVVAGFSDRVMVMYGGRVHEVGPTSEIYYRSRGPYTWGLLDTIPRLDRPPGLGLNPIEGTAPSLTSPPAGCRFEPRCRHAQEVCSTSNPPLVSIDGNGHLTACHFAGDEEWLGSRMGVLPSRETAIATPTHVKRKSAPLLEIVDLVKHIPISGGMVFNRRVGHVKAVDGVSLSIEKGETFGLVGESGCGKTTTGRLIMRLLDPTSGRIGFAGLDVLSLRGGDLRSYRRRVQMVHQDPYSSLNPRMRLRDIVAEPLRIHNEDTRAGINRRVRELLEVVGLDVSHESRYPHEFSGGQRQRIGIARALALRPELLILDEPVSALDVSIQAQILNLLSRLQDEFHLTYLIIAHDLAVVRHLAQRIGVMYLGRIVELGDRDDLYERPAHPYAQALLSAIPIPDPDREKVRVRRRLMGDPPSPSNPPPGCTFHPRCWKAEDRCAREVPGLEERVANGTLSACHFAESIELTGMQS